MDSDTILTTPRSVTCGWHLRQTKRLLDFDAGRHLDSVLVYVALELRSAIERYSCEILFLLRSGRVTERDAKQCRRIGGIFGLIKAEDSLYRKTIAFANIITSTIPVLSEVKMADTSRLHRYWYDLSELCHKQLDPSETFRSANRDLQSRGFALLDAA